MTTYTPQQYAEHLRTAGKRLNEKIIPVLDRAAFDVRDGWKKRAAAANKLHAPDYAKAIYRGKLEVRDDVMSVTIQPSGYGQGKLGMVLEYGSPTSAPQLSHVAAAKEEAPDLLKWCRKVAAEVPR